MARKLINLRQHRLKQLADADKKRKYGNDENDQEVGKVEGVKANPWKKIKTDQSKQQMKKEGRKQFSDRPDRSYNPGKDMGNGWVNYRRTQASIKRDAHNQKPRLPSNEKPLLQNGATYKESTTSKSGSKEAKIGAGIYPGKG
jgi:hypothetical protein